MASVPKSNFEPAVGEQVVLLWQTDDRPMWTTGTIRSGSPFALEVDSTWVQTLHSKPTLVLIHDCGRCVAKADAKIEKAVPCGGRSVLTFGHFTWDVIESRDHPRHHFEAQAIVRSIAEHGNGVEMEDQFALTKNISLGGALVRVVRPLCLGELVEFSLATVYFGTVRALGVVAHSNEAGTTVGLNFIEYIGASRKSLQDFLTGMAA